jgi:hypothetical protein
VTEVLRYGLIGLQDLKVGTSSFETRLGDGRVVTLNEINFARLEASVIYDPPSLAVGDGVTTNVTVTGAALGDPIAVGFSVALPIGMFMTAAVISSNTVRVTLFNFSTAVQDLAEGTLRVTVFDGI